MGSTYRLPEYNSTTNLILMRRKQNHFLEDGVLWYCLEWGVEWYRSMNIHQRINLKQSYFQPNN